VEWAIQPKRKGIETMTVTVKEIAMPSVDIAIPSIDPATPREVAQWIVNGMEERLLVSNGGVARTLLNGAAFVCQRMTLAQRSEVLREMLHIARFKEC
jgi:hypothetical protein